MLTISSVFKDIMIGCLCGTLMAGIFCFLFKEMKLERAGMQFLFTVMTVLTLSATLLGHLGRICEGRIDDPRQAYQQIGFFAVWSVAIRLLKPPSKRKKIRS